jgi:hypothetical protein
MSNPKQLNYTQQLEHRIKMIKEDLDVINQFITENNLEEIFKRKTHTSDDAFCNLHNIEIACDLNDSESLSWGSWG